jgi:hypothetical protein
MGASVTAYWPGITEEQFEDQPGFWNDDKAWGNFMAEREGEPQVLHFIKTIGASALLTVKTDGWDDDDVTWVTPRDLYDAAARLEQAIHRKTPGIEQVLTIYAGNANHLDPVEVELLRDLEDIKAIATWAQQQGTDKMTLEMNW